MVPLRLNSSDMKLRFILFTPPSSNWPHTEQTNSDVFNYSKNIDIEKTIKTLTLHLLYAGKGCVHVEEIKVLLLPSPSYEWGLSSSTAGNLPYLMLKRLSACLRSWRIISPMSSTKLPAEWVKHLKKTLNTKSTKRELLHEGSSVSGSPPACEHCYVFLRWLYFDKFHLPYTDLVLTNWPCGVLITWDHNKWTQERRKW